MNVGDVVRYDRAAARELTSPLWAMAVGRADAIMLTEGATFARRGAVYSTCAESTYVNDNVAKTHVIDPEEWPDEVCAAVAQYRLTGELP
jgi:hypothetical protein